AGQEFPSIIPDGSNGAIICWDDNRVSLNVDVYAQRLNGSGVPQWTANGVPVSAVPASNERYPKIAALSPGGAGIVVWEDARNGPIDIFAQRLTLNGTAGFDHTVTATALANGSISPSGSVGVFDDSSQMFAIIASPGYHVRSVTVDGAPAGVDTSYTFYT